MSVCDHPRLRIVPCDQTLGLECETCGDLVAHCWTDEHISERLWNRACTNDPGGNRCEQDRDNICALCQLEIS